MRYMFMLFGEEDTWARMSQDEREAAYARHEAFAEALLEAGKTLEGEELAPSHAATTVDFDRGGEVSDGPFIETKEQLGGYYIIDCQDLDEALAWARKLPMDGGTVEIRPLVEHTGG
jgi:hypothetical protein